jgi:hypothetical protein
MQIDLTDHLRCLEPHDESFLVLLTGQMIGRRVIMGHLGCPVCGKEVKIRNGEVRFAEPDPGDEYSTLTPEGTAAFLGLGGPGGWVALAGSAAGLARDLAPLLPGVQLVAVNPPVRAEPDDAASVILAPRLPLTSASMRGVVIGADLARASDWVADAVRVVLPGLRIVVEGPAPSPPPDGVEILASAPGCWVGKKVSGKR